MSTFPKRQFGTGKQATERSFDSKWYSKYNWLEYSVEKDAVYCFYCRFYAIDNSACKGHIDSAFISNGFCSWKKQYEQYKNHDLSQCHQISVELVSHNRKNEPIDVQLDEARKNNLNKKEQQRQASREYMKQLIDIICMLVKGGRSLRGHNETKESDNRGLFLDIVDLFVKYCPFTKNYLENAPKNCTYQSNRIQNDILQSVSNVMLRKIQNEMIDVPFSIMADETPDICNHEQMAVVFRYYIPGSQYPIERFVALERLKSADAESIFNAIDSIVKKMHLDWKNVQSICFDGASTMAGHITGVQARCKEMNRSICFVHCYAHCLNLALVSSCASHKDNPIIFDFFGTIQLIYSFIEGSPKRHEVFEELTKITDRKIKTLKSLSKTRWACRAEAVSAVYENFQIIVEAIETIISSTSDAKIRAMGRGILAQIRSFDFIIALEIMHPVLQMIVIVSNLLQQAGLDLCEAMYRVNDLSNALTAFRNNESVYDEMYSTATKICNTLEIEIPVVRKRKIAKKIDDHSNTSFVAETKKDQIKYFTFYPVLDSLIHNLQQRFNQETQQLIRSTTKLMRLEKWEDSDLTTVSQRFALDQGRLKAEVRLLEQALTKNTISFPLTVPGWLEWFSHNERHKSYENYSKMVEYFSVIPVTSCTCERCFSKLQILLSKLRSTMLQERVFNLLLPFVEQNMAAELDFEDIIDEFKKMVPFERRLNL